MRKPYFPPSFLIDVIFLDGMKITTYGGVGVMSVKILVPGGATAARS
jgi:hypothetical protein